MTYTYKYRVDSHGTDINGNASVTAVMQYIQETANLQHEEYGPTMPQLRAEGKAFVLSRCALDIMLPLRAQDTVSVETWLTEAHGYGFARNSVLYLGDEPAAKMTALWGVIDIPTRKPLRADEIKLGFGTDGRSLEVSSPLRFRIPSEDIRSFTATATRTCTSTTQDMLRCSATFSPICAEKERRVFR